MPPPRASSSLARQLMLGLGLAIGAASSLAIVVVVVIATRRAEADLQRGADTAIATLARALEGPVWNLDMDQARAIGEAFAADPRIVRLEIREFTGGQRRVIERGSVDDAVVRSVMIRHGEREVGQASIALSRAPDRAAMWRQLAIASTVLVIALITAFATARLFVRRMLQRPLTALSGVVNAYAAGDYRGESAPVRYTEFDAFAGVLADMGVRLRQHLEALHAEVRAHRQTADDLQRSRNMLARVMDSVPHAIFWKDRDSVYLGSNSKFAQAVSVTTPDDVIGRTDFDLTLPHAIADTYRADDLEVITSGRAKSYIVEPNPQGDGSLRWIATSKIPLTDQRGQVYGLLGISEDITERKRSEEALQRSNRELAAINRLLGLAASDIEAAELLEIACRELADLLNAPLAAAGLTTDVGDALTIVAEHGTSIFDRLAGATVSTVDHPLWRRLITDRGAVSVDVARERASISTLAPWLQSQGIESLLVLPLVLDHIVVGAIALASHEVRAFPTESVTLAMGVTGHVAHALARQRAAATERRLRAAIEQTPDSIIVTDTQGTIVYVNPAFSDVTGYSRAEAMGQNPRLLRSGQEDAAFYQHMWSTISAGLVWQGRIRNKRKNGQVFTEDASIAPIRDSRGTIINYLAVKRDVTHELALEERYLHAQRMEAVGQLAGGVAHDFNNLLSVILMQADIIPLAGNVPPHIVDGLQHMRAAAERAANLTRQLLMFSRRQAMSVHVHDLSIVASNLLRMLRRVIGETIDLSFEPADGPVFFSGDAGMIEQVIMNLCVNARDAMPNGGRVKLTTRRITLDAEEAALHAGARPGRFIRLSVIDTGSGMDENTLNHLFEPFFTTKGVGKGTGLGLATTHGIVTQHDGWITVDSVLGRGTAFHVFLPAFEEAVTSVTRDASEHVWSGQGSVLLVEDEQAIRTMTSEALRRLGYRVVEAPNGVEAMAMWEAEGGRIDLLLTDMVMPNGVSGLELSRRLRKLKKDLRVVIVSGYSSALPYDAGPIAESVEYLSKPYTLSALSDVLRRVLGGS